MVEDIKVEILRMKLPTETLGTLNVLKGKEIIFTCKTMELPWNNNKHNISCIPDGEYIGNKQKAEERRNYDYIRFSPVKGRNIDSVTKLSSILMHRITYVKDLLGCIGIGGKFFDLNKDGVPDIIESGKTLQTLYDILPDKFPITIKWR